MDLKPGTFTCGIKMDGDITCLLAPNYGSPDGRDMQASLTKRMNYQGLWLIHCIISTCY